MSTIASSPFDRSDADVILQSSDGIDYRVHKNILSIASPFFDALFSVPQPKSCEEESTLPTVTFNEDSETLDILLCGLYPIDEPIIADVNVLMKVLAAVDKYQVDKTLRYLEQVYIRLCRDEINKEPIKAYVLAGQHKWKNAMRAAAKASLYIPHHRILAQLEDINCSPIANECIKLIRYHFKCYSATRSFLDASPTCNSITKARNALLVKGPLEIVTDLDSAVRADIVSHNQTAATLSVIPSNLRSHLDNSIGKDIFGPLFEG
ncbi:hypothetical protein ONZ45_g10083 [Pleurotus djamor]|nr:hypothetical protein ONZ45_g10083 [Pleurotus djamor]